VTPNPLNISLSLASKLLRRHVPKLLHAVVINNALEAAFIARPNVSDLSSVSLAAQAPPIVLDQIKNIFSPEHQWCRIRRLRLHSSQVEPLLPSAVSSFRNLDTLIVEEPFLPSIRYSDKSKDIWALSKLCKNLNHLVVPPSALFPTLRDHQHLQDFIHHIKQECPERLASLQNVFVWLDGAIPIPFWWIGSALPKGYSVEDCIQALDYLDDINIQFEGGDSVLSHLMRMEEFFEPVEHLSLVKAVLSRGGDPMVPIALRDGTVTNALQLSAALPTSDEMPSLFDLVLDAAISGGQILCGSMMGLVSSQGHSPLHLASHGTLKQIQLIHDRLMKDVGLNFMEHSSCVDGETPLLVSSSNLSRYSTSVYAVSAYRPLPSLLAFVKLGANVFATSSKGKTILDQVFKFAAPTEGDGDLQCAEFLMETVSIQEGWILRNLTTIHPSWIARAASLPDSHLRRVVSLLIRPNNSASSWTEALLNTRNAGLTLDGIKWLMANGADLNFVNPRHLCEHDGDVILNSTPIMAIACHSPDLVPLLMDLGADATLSPHGYSLLDVMCLQCSRAGNESWNKIIHDISLCLMESGHVSLVVRSLSHSRGTPLQESPTIQDLFMEILSPKEKYLDQFCQDSRAVEAALIQCLFPSDLLSRLSDADHLDVTKQFCGLWRNCYSSPMILGTSSIQYSIVV
jgi:hypothetical protein